MTTNSPETPEGLGGLPYGSGTRMLTLAQVCEWFNITERHVRKLVARDAIPFRKVGHLLRFPEWEVEQWSHPSQRMHESAEGLPIERVPGVRRGRSRRAGALRLPKSLIE
ncbi:MAG: helix-turn-helix domain-containing protein [Actinomycetales bacterium]|nr:helix-turn-helix domain-containing protein [Actinomycetales bacterium]